MPLLGFEILSWLSMAAAVRSIRGYGVALAVGDRECVEAGENATRGIL
jgi:hypothetical protein